jgi:hypothetical protein
MANQRSRAVVPAAASPSLVGLDEDAQAKVLCAAKTYGVSLAALASSSQHLCRLVRSRVPVNLQVTTPAQAALVLRSHASGRPPFSACPALTVTVDTPAAGLGAFGVFSAAQRWTALQRVELDLRLTTQQLQPGQTLDHCTAGILGALPALKGLRSLALIVQEFSACSAAQLGQLGQVTSLELECTAAGAAAADWSALRGMTSLVKLVLTAPAMQPAAGAAGPFCFPSSLTSLDITDPDDERASPACIPRCLTHLPGCPALQELRIYYTDKQHHSAHPRAVVHLLAVHNRQLRKLQFEHEIWETEWDAQVAGLPQADAAGAADTAWRPDASLASLQGLEVLEGGRWLCLEHPDDWQHLVQLTALTTLDVLVLCPPPPGVTLRVPFIRFCVAVHGADVGRALLACAGLQRASLFVEGVDGSETETALPPGVLRLAAHPALRELQLDTVASWEPTAAANWAALAPVLAGVSRLSLNQWPRRGSSACRHAGLPDLTPCTALTELVLDCRGLPAVDETTLPEQEDFLAMLAPLVQLQRLHISHARRLNARAALVLQTMLPQLQQLTLESCGSRAPLEAAAAAGHQGREQVLGKVKQLLRDGLELVVR